MRIALMVIRLIYVVPVYMIKFWWMGRHATKEATYAYVKKATKNANRAGRVNIEVNGVENLPEKDGFIMFPNHQGLYDVLVFLDSCPRAFSFVVKKEVKDVPLLKQVIGALHSLSMNREDLRQSMKVIQTMTRRVSAGENFLIFAEGTRSKLGNRMLEMKAGSFKSAVKAKCPIVPCALIDSFKPFDSNSIAPVTVKVFYLTPIEYDEYKDMTTLEIATLVKSRIEEVLVREDPE